MVYKSLLKKIFQKKNVIFLMFLGTSNAEFEKPFQIDLFSPPMVRMIIGGIEESDYSYVDKQRLLHNSFQVRYQGKSCRTDQNGSFYFEKNAEPLTTPLYILISNSCYWTKKKDVYHNYSFFSPVLKQLEDKPFSFYEQQIKNGLLCFEKKNELLKNFNFEVPGDQTIIFNINPDFVEDEIKPVSNFLHHSSFLVLPHLKIKKTENIYQMKMEKNLQKNKPYSSSFMNFRKRLSSKNSLRKIKHGMFHKKETDIYQLSTEININNRRKKFVLMNRIKN